MKKKMTQKHKAMAYVLNQDESFNKSQSEIAKFFGVSQSRISEGIKDIKSEITIRDLTRELDEARQTLAEHKLLPQSPILYIDADVDED